MQPKQPPTPAAVFMSKSCKFSDNYQKNMRMHKCCNKISGVINVKMTIINILSTKCGKIKSKFNKINNIDYICYKTCKIRCF